MPYIYSTLSNDNHYHLHTEPTNKKSQEVRDIIKTVTIKGGAGIATKQLITPLGVVTKVTDEELKFLEADEAFQTHLRNGFVKIERKKYDVDKVVPDMSSRDGSDPITPEDSKGLEGVEVSKKKAIVKSNLR